MPPKPKPDDDEHLQSAPWIDDPDEPDRMTDAEIDQMVKGFEKLAPDLVKKE